MLAKKAMLVLTISVGKVDWGNAPSPRRSRVLTAVLSTDQQSEYTGWKHASETIALSQSWQDNAASFRIEERDCFINFSRTFGQKSVML